MKKRVFRVAIILTLFVLSFLGCLGPEYIKKYVKMRSAIHIGMTQSQVKELWGPPDSVEKSHLPTKEGEHEVWVYKNGVKIIFIDEKVREIW
jgi:hypothetical protein